MIEVNQETKSLQLSFECINCKHQIEVKIDNFPQPILDADNYSESVKTDLLEIECPHCKKEQYNILLSAGLGDKSIVVSTYKGGYIDDEKVKIMTTKYTYQTTDDSLEISLTLKSDKEVSFCLMEDDIHRNKMLLRPSEGSVPITIPLLVDESIGTFTIEPSFDVSKFFLDTKETINEKLATLFGEWNTSKNIGFDVSTGIKETIISEKVNYTPESIFVENKPFSIRQMVDFIDKKILILNPEFQRNFIWDRKRQSRLIESIILGFPLPSFYLSQFSDGSLTVVDGLQRLSTIKSFIKDELVLTDLEYLLNCEGKTYSQLESILPPLSYRLFDQTTLNCFVINYRSPIRLKFDLFKRLNTGGIPLNSQEIRNCMSREPLQLALKRMISTEFFNKTIGESINNYRMDCQELALRFIYFYDQYSDNNPIGNYKGDLEASMNNKIEELNELSDFANYEKAFENALKHAYSLFGSYTFRKVLPNDDRRRRINKSLFVAISVLLAKKGEKYYTRNNNIISRLSEMLHSDERFLNALTWSTTSVANISYVFGCIQKLFNETILKED